MKVRKQHLQIAVIVLAVSVLWSVWTFMRPAARSATPARQVPALGTEPAPMVAGPITLDPLSIPPPADIDVVLAPSWTPDPFLFGNESRTLTTVNLAAPVTSNPMVRSILFSSTRRTAIVDNKMVGVGDSVGTFKVEEIERDAVVFVTESGERRRVSLRKAAPAGIRR